MRHPNKEPDQAFVKLQQALAGRYSIEKEIGRGGMGIVYLAREVKLDRQVALKVLRPEFAVQPTARQRFLAEARFAAKLSHPNIVPIFTADEVGEFVFFAMAYIEGETLGERLRTRGPLSHSEAARVLREVAWALAYAHDQGIVHRDVKPDNILLDENSGRALVADFGIAAAAESEGSAEAGVVSGTAEFMSPEQAIGEAAQPASDIYSLGVVGYYVLTGRLPFSGNAPTEILAKHVNDAPPSVASVAQAVPRQTARVVDRCLAKNPSERFSDAAELAEVLSQALDTRTEVPVALRVFLRHTTGRNHTAGAALFYLFLLPVAVGAAGTGPNSFLIAIWIILCGLPLPPLAVLRRLTVNARTLLKSGVGRAQLIEVLEARVQRAREEGDFLYGENPWDERIVRWVAVGALSLAGTSLLIPLEASVRALLFGVCLWTGTVAAVLTLWRWRRRRDWTSEKWKWFWESRFGRWIFKLAGVGLDEPPEVSPANQHTEMAIGLAVENMYEQLPRKLRDAAGDVPAVLRDLQADARKMRHRIEELNELLDQLRNQPTRSRSLEHPVRDSTSAAAEERRKLEGKLRETKHAAEERLSAAVAALETLRLGLLRMQAGSLNVESFTDDFAAAKEVADDIQRLTEAQEELETMLQDSESLAVG